MRSTTKKAACAAAAVCLIAGLGAGTAFAFNAETGEGWWSSANEWWEGNTTYSLSVESADYFEDTTAEIPAEGVSGSYGDNVTFTLSADGALDIQGEGVLGGDKAGYTEKYPPWEQYKGAIKSVTISAGITEISLQPFQDCAAMETFTIPDDTQLTVIDQYAFQHCTSLTSFSIPASVTIIQQSTFEGCTSLASVEIPEGVTDIGTRAFFGCHSLESVYLPDSVEDVGPGAFEQCFALTEVSLPEGTNTRWETFGYYAGESYDTAAAWNYLDQQTEENYPVITLR